MKIEHLYYFLIIAETKSINKASHRLFISQQHLSRIVNTLEDALQVQLLQRNTSGIELTEKGKVFLQFAEKIVNDYREMQSYFYLDTLPSLDAQESVQGNCKIMFPFFFSLFLNDFMQKLNSQYPNIHVNYFENMGAYSNDDVAQSDILYLFLDNLEEKSHFIKDTLTSYYIGETSASICINKSSPYANKTMITKEELSTMRLTTYPQESWSGMVGNSNNILFSSSNIYQHLDSVVHNHSVCLVPTYVQSGVRANYPDIVLLPFESHFTFPIYVLHNKKHVLTNAEKAVIRFLGQYIQTLNQV